MTKKLETSYECSKEERSEGMKSNDYGGSLPVESVQALASKSLKEVPPCYLRHEDELGEVSGEDDRGSLRIPIIDMRKLLDDHQHPFGSSHRDELARLHSACKHWGFFQLINHGIPEEVIEKMKISAEEFFKLPQEEKKAFSQLPNNVEGYGQAFVVSEEQKLDWGDMFYIISRPISQRNNRFWPTHPNSFRENLDKYTSELHGVGDRLIKFMSWNLRLNSEALTKLFEDGRQSVRINLYPPCVEAGKVLGISPHSDATALTLLLQANDVEGLQIKKDGLWVPVKPIPGALIVNIGDILEIMSNGEYKSIEHRATVNREKNRISIATFHNPNTKAQIGPLSDLLNHSQKAKYKTVSCEDFLRLVFSSKLNSKSLVDQMKLKE